MDAVVYAFRPDARDWYKQEEFAIQSVINGEAQIKLGWALVKKAVLDGSTNTSWNDQKQLLAQYETELRNKSAGNYAAKRRTAAEAFYDTLFYYSE